MHHLCALWFGTAMALAQPPSPPAVPRPGQAPPAAAPTQTPNPNPNSAQTPTPSGGQRLAASRSPYLRSHQHDPVAWYPWGAEAFAAARAQDRPVLLSIGYAACHWCHVMAAESFQNREVARLLNEHFVCIKVDREEHPDVDEVYLAALAAMGHDGGWPLTMFLLPDGRPFFGGTYFPPQDQPGRPAFQRVLEHLQKSWRERRPEIDRGAAEFAAELRTLLAPELPPGTPDAGLLPAAVAALAASQDAEHGGFGAAPLFAPKFPPSVELRFLLGRPEPAAQAMVLRTLSALAEGALRDDLGGGFHRYATDRRWRSVHFEKMLYDNAQLAAVFALAHRAGMAKAGAVAAATLEFLQRELLGPEGGFWASQDADGPDGEGACFTWTAAEFRELLAGDAELAAQHFGLDLAAPGRQTLRSALASDVLAASRHEPLPEVLRRLERARQALRAARASRPQPTVDDKVVAAWHGLALSAFALGHRTLGGTQYLAVAQRGAAFACEHLIREGRCQRSWWRGAPGPAGVLEDHALLAQGLLDVFECDGEPRWLAAAAALLRTAVAEFGAPDGSWFQGPQDQGPLWLRGKSLTDGPLPAGSAAVCQALLRAGHLLADPALLARGRQGLAALHGALQRTPQSTTAALAALQFDLADPSEVVVVGPPDDPRTAALLRAAWSLPNAVVLWLHDGNRTALAAATPLAAEKTLVDGAPTVYRCRAGVCQAPSHDPASLRP
jgi:uncharacterized protein YyaL (SSP411 family)